MQYIISLILPLLALAAESKEPLTLSQIQSRLQPMQKIQILEAQFQQSKMLKRFKTELKSKGRIIFKRQDPTPYIMWEVIEPSPMKMEISEGKLLLTELQYGRSSVKKIPLNQGGQELQAMLSWLTLNGEAMQKHYRVYGSKNTLQLYPKKATTSMERIKLSELKDGFFEKIQIFEKTDDYTLIRFSKIKKQL